MTESSGALDPWAVCLTPADVLYARARVEQGEAILRSPPDEDSQSIQDLQRMSPGELEYEARKCDSACAPSGD